MPFGLIFGAMFFFLAAWTGLQLLSVPGPQAKAGGLLMLVLGVTLALGLVSRREWARWIGAVSAVGIAIFAWLRVGTAGTALDFVLLIAGVVAAALLVLPASSRVEASRPDSPSRVLPAISAVAAAGLFAVALWAMLSPVEALVDEGAREAATTSQAGDTSGRVRWADFGRGMDRARSEDKPLLVNFNATWCGYCKKMDRQTWSHPSVLDRMSDVVAVRVDIDDERSMNGYSGTELARTFRVNGTPTQLLIDPSGRVLARAGGFQTPRQLLTWLESTLGAQGTGRAPVAGP